MKNLLLVLTLSTLLSCVQSAKNSAILERSPASGMEEKFKAFFDTTLKIIEDDQTRKYIIVRLPLESEGDLKPAGAYADAISVVKDPRLQIDFLEYANAVQGGERTTNFLILQSFLQKNYSLEQRMKILNACMKAPYKRGDRFQFAPVSISFFCGMGAYRALYSLEELREAFINFPASPQGVIYDGEYGFHVYKDEKLKFLVNTIASAMNLQKIQAYEVFHSLPGYIKTKFTVDHDGLSEADKIEPFDLISNLTTAHLLKDDNELNKIQISKLAQKATAQFFLMVGPEHRHLNLIPSMSVAKHDDKFSVLCANGIFQSKRGQTVFNHSWSNDFQSELVEAWNSRIDLKTVSIEKALSLPMICNSNEFRVDLKAQPAAKLPIPKDLNYLSKKSVNALLTISLSNEINFEAIQKAKFLISTLAGWTIDKDIEVVVTKDYFEREFINVDAYIPVMHSMDLNYFNIGTELSYAIKLKKTIVGLDGKSRDLKLTVLFPNGASIGKSYILKPNDLAEMMDKRYTKKNSSLFLMNTSCASEKTLVAWALVFRKALELRKARHANFDINQVTDFPHVIGSKKYFSTSSTAAILSHAEFPLRSLEILTEGKGMADVLSFLKTPTSQGYISKLGNLFSLNSATEADSKTGFEPEYVLDYPELLQTGGVEITVTGRGIKGRNQY